MYLILFSCSTNIKTSACDPRESSDVSWSLTTGHIETKPLQSLGKKFMSSLGDDVLSTSNTLGVNH